MKNLGALTWLISGRARGGRARLIGTAAGLAVGTMLLLLVVAAYQGLNERSVRTDEYTELGYSIIESADYAPVDPASFRGEIEAGSWPGPNEILTPQGGPKYGNDLFLDKSITRIDVAVSQNSKVKLPGLEAMPKPGEFYASPALTELISKSPQDQLGDRYGVQAGLISAEGLAGPDTLIAVVGHDPATLAQSGATSITDVTKTAIQHYPNESYQTIAIVGGIATLFPVVVLIAIITRLGQAARSDRIRTLGLMGATPAQISSTAALETALVGTVGTLAGIALYWISLPFVAQLSLEGSRFYTADLALQPSAIVGVAFIVIASTTLAAFVSAMRSQRTAPGTGRDQAEPQPRLWRLVPLALGVGIFALTALTSRLSESWTGEQLASAPLGIVMRFVDIAMIPNFLLIAIGLVLAGPLLLFWIARAAAQRARSAAGILALGRLIRHPAATFRAVSGLVVALFVVTVFAVGLTTNRTADTESAVAASDPDRVDTRVFLAPFWFSELANVPNSDTVKTSAAAVAAATSSAKSIANIDGVEGAYVIFQTPPDSNSDANRYFLRAADARGLGLEVPPGADAVTVNYDYFSALPEDAPPVSIKASPETPPPYSQPSMLLVKTDNSKAVIERTRTALMTDPIFDFLAMGAPRTINEGMSTEGTLNWAKQYAGLANIGIVIAALISVVSLAISTTGGVIERRRALALLRLTGMPAKKLRRMITIETAVPFASVFLLCVGLGAFVAWALITSLNAKRTVTWPEPGYYLAVAFCIAMAIVSVLATFRTARSTTAITATRFE